jgi:hypothetical protein
VENTRLNISVSLKLGFVRDGAGIVTFMPVWRQQGKVGCRQLDRWFLTEGHISFPPSLSGVFRELRDRHH